MVTDSNRWSMGIPHLVRNSRKQRFSADWQLLLRRAQRRRRIRRQLLPRAICALQLQVIKQQ